VSAIIAEYGLADKIGYFTTDNASSNKSCMDELAKEHSFASEERWIRCCGHIFNLVGKQRSLATTSRCLVTISSKWRTKNAGYRSGDGEVQLASSITWSAGSTGLRSVVSGSNCCNKN
jgi:hypothetical protein